jgi:hypothetical protein
MKELPALEELPAAEDSLAVRWRDLPEQACNPPSSEEAEFCDVGEMRPLKGSCVRGLIWALLVEGVAVAGAFLVWYAWHRLRG